MSAEKSVGRQNRKSEMINQPITKMVYGDKLGFFGSGRSLLIKDTSYNRPGIMNTGGKGWGK